MKAVFLTVTLLSSIAAATAQTIVSDTAMAITTTGTTSTKEHELEEVHVSTTRSSRSISDIPTRIEFIAGEELDEKSNMKPGDIRMLLAESTGVQAQ